MAFLGVNDDDDQPTSSSSSNARAAAASAQGLPYGGASGGFVGGTGTGSGQGATTTMPATSTSAQAPRGNSYANLSQYLQANQGTGAMTGRAAENVVQQSADQAKGLQNAYQSQASSEIENATKPLQLNQDTIAKIKSGTATVDQGTLDKIAKGAYTYSPTQVGDYGKADEKVLNNIVASGSAATSPYSGPTDFSKVVYGGPSLDQVKVGPYGGPTSANIGGFSANTEAARQAALQQAGVAQGNVQNAQGGQSGVAALLRQAYQQPNYTVGENSLDSFLAGGTQGGRQALGQAAGVGKDVADSYSKIQDALSGKINTGLGLSDQTNKAYQDAINAATKASGATADTYNKAVQAATAQGTANETAAQNAAKLAQDELNKRAQAAAEAKKAADAAAAKQAADEAAAKKAAATKATQTAPTTGTNAPGETLNDVAFGDLVGLRNNIGNAAQQAAHYLNPVYGVNRLSNQLAAWAKQAGVPTTPTNALNQITQAAQNAGGAVSGVTKDIGNQLSTAGQAIGGAASNAAKTSGSSIAKAAKKLHFAHGGEVPSYNQLVSRLRRR